ncbi:MAG: hypothetical protein C0624_03080, partial [Desulfuromonas sp.]
LDDGKPYEDVLRIVTVREPQQIVDPTEAHITAVQGGKEAEPGRGVQRGGAKTRSRSLRA